MGLGALHAFAPGHGKTVMAAYLVGERGSARHGLAIGLTVAVTHTLGVLALGLALTASQAFAPESVYPWLGVASGVTLRRARLHPAVARAPTPPRHRDLDVPLATPTARATITTTTATAMITGTTMIMGPMTMTMTMTMTTTTATAIHRGTRCRGRTSSPSASPAG